uniref:DIX domain-containing protein n=1 Tax=Noctiluca scintillans TaxID=2966 RepID=A0A7S1FKA8_NOCSC|mmetsp:Transcript_8724/g.24379  ORF Transcript_8724/g.24379 Transcript_8724/m.24379 type:complete len:158 (+) Transcript_8724:66-539(+)
MSQGPQQPLFVYYWLPGDNDDADHPNAFTVMRTGSWVKLRDIKAKFPLPGTYHFRFKMKWDANAIWMDVTNEDSAVPLFDDKIFAKVLRLTWDDGREALAPAASAPPQQPPPVQRNSNVVPDDMLNFGDSGHQGPEQKAAPAPVQAPKTDDFDMFFS